MRRYVTALVATLVATLVAVASLAGAPVRAQDTVLERAPPRLVVAISVDQFSADLFAEYRQHFTQGLGRLLQGAVFPSGFQSHAATETCPGHSTILTGAHPARTGIVANNWFDPGLARADKRVYCVEDERDPASSSGNPVVSARHLRVPTLGDRLKAANPSNRNVAVAGKDRAAIMMGGHAIDQVYWWKNGFVTLAGRKPDPAAVEASAAASKLIGEGAPELPVPAWCAGKDRAIPVGGGTVGTGRFALRAGNEFDFRASPRLDRATLDLAARLAERMKLGRGRAADVLSVSLSATDYVGHGAGTEGVEMCIQLAEVDQALGDFFARLDAQGVDYVAVLTADHGGFDLPERLVQQGYPARRIDGTLGLKTLAAAVLAQTGVAAPAGDLLYADGTGGDIYLSKALSPEDRAKVATALAALLRANPQVEAVFTAQELAETPMPAGSPQDWTLRQRARASFDPERSGEVVVLLKRGLVPITRGAPGRATTHGSPWDYDRRVPILFWRKGLTGLEQPAPVETVDIAPTLAGMLGLAVPAGAFDGRCLDIDGGAGDSCNAVH